MARLRPLAEINARQYPPGVVTDETLAGMVEAARIWKRSPVIIELGNEIIASLPRKHYFGEALALFDWVRDNIRYSLDVNGVEVVQSPEYTIAVEHGDCDDMATLLATLWEATGKPARFVAAGFNGGEIEHVWPEVLVGRRWIAGDPTEDHPFGWKPEAITTRRIAHI